MSLLKMIKSQLGLSATAANNFVLDASADNGTMKLARGNAGATTQDILTVDAAGRVAMPNSVVAFGAYQSTLQSLANNTVALITLQTKEFDTTASFNNTASPVTLNAVSVPAYSFLPIVPGYYQVNWSLGITSAAASLVSFLNKNGLRLKDGTTFGSVAAAGVASSGSAIVYLNGTTDYISMSSYQNSGGALNTSAVANVCSISAILIAKV